MSLRARLLLALAYVLVLAIVALLVPLVRSVRARVDAEVKTQALAQAELVAATAVGADDLAGLARRAAQNVRGRVVIVGRSGRVRADSGGVPVGADYASRPEIAAALHGRVVQIQRASDTLHERILATAVPVVVGGRPAGAVRVTQSVAAVRHAVNAASLGLAAIGAVVLLLGLAAGAVVAGQIARPLHRLAGVARRIEAGEESVRAPEEGSADQRALARAFNDMTARVTRSLEAQREFVADASHQLRTPLAGLRLRLEEAAVAAPGGAAGAQLAGALREVDRLGTIVGDLLVLSEAERPAAPVAEAVDPGAAAQAAAARWGAAAGERGSRVVAEGDGAPVRCAPADLDRILDALVENALAYGPARQTVRITAAGGRLEVRDEGAGVAPEEAEAVFSRFHRGVSGRASGPGTGLGLPIARELARRWGGDVTLAGACAAVRLPEAAP